MTLEAVETSSEEGTAPAGTELRQRAGVYYLLALAVSGAVGALSLTFLPDSLAYDPWSWLIWGRELAHGNLVTAGAASSVKPFPMAVNVLGSMAGKAAPDIWLVVARAGTCMAVLLSYRLGSRLAGRPAGIVAALGFLTTASLVGYVAIQGMSEPIGVAFALAAVDAHLSGRRWPTFLALLGAAAIRIEVVVFMIPYGLIWLVRPARHRVRSFMAGAAIIALIVAMWFLPDLLSAGSLLRSATQASQQSQGGPLLSSFPAGATITEFLGMPLTPIIVGYLGSLAVGFVGWYRNRRHLEPAFLVPLLAAAWVLLEALMAQADLATGASRYLLTAAALAAVSSGWFWVQCAKWVAAHAGARRTAAVAAVWVVLVGVCAPGVDYVINRISGGLAVGQSIADLADTLPSAVKTAGGSAHVLACGPVYTADLQVPAVAWRLNLTLGQVGVDPGPKGTLFSRGPGWPPISPTWWDRYTVVSPSDVPLGDWLVQTTCPPRS